MKFSSFVAIVLSFVSAFFILKAGREWPLLDIEDLAPGVSFDKPVHIGFLPDSSSEHEAKLIVCEKAGALRWVYPGSRQIEGTLIDLRERVYSGGNEEGLLSATFDPKFPEHPYLYLFYSLNKPRRSRIARFVVGRDLRADPASELVILEIRKYRDTHNGGLIMFDKTGMLLASFGDAEGAEKFGDKMQARRTLLGTIVRLDVSNASPKEAYRIPPDNPFVGARDGSMPEIWAYGFRNPWRYSIDAQTGELIVADVGMDLREEVDRVVKGGNYGWPVYEGDLCRATDQAKCKDESLRAPLLAVDHKLSRAVAGAVEYQGNLVPSLHGRVIFADYLRGFYSFVPDSGATLHDARLDLYKWPTRYGPNIGRTFIVASLTQGPDQEMYVANLSGTIGRLKEIDWWTQARGFFFAMWNFR